MPEPRDWQQDLRSVDELMRAVSREADPQRMVRLYGEGMRKLRPRDAIHSFSRRGTEPPYYRITRSSHWTDEIDPWRQKERLPLLKGGILGEWIYRGEPVVTTDLRVPSDDPAAEYLRDYRGAIVMPHYDDGVALNMAAILWKNPADVPVDQAANLLWQANLFGRGTLNLVLRRELSQAYDAINNELKIVGDIQRSLLPETLPEIPTLDLAAHYQTSVQAGGDYYDIFPLPDNQWGIFIADVSGHGTPAAVVMAITHAIVHSYPGPTMPPGLVLQHLNTKLCNHYTARNPAFVTAFYAVYNPATHVFTYASAGHNPPRLKTTLGVRAMDEVASLPLGIRPEEIYVEHAVNLTPGDTVLLYTDGVTESFNTAREMFGEERLDTLLARHHANPDRLIEAILVAVSDFTDARPAADDRTILAITVRANASHAG